jgi:hypothetical protein
MNLHSFVFAIAFPAFAILLGPETSSLIPIEKVSIQLGGDERLTATEYDAEFGRQSGDFFRKYSGSVKIKCPFRWSSGSMVYKNDLTVTVAHAFQNDNPNRKNTCLPVSDDEIGQCYVQSMNAGPNDPKCFVDPTTISHPYFSGSCTTGKNGGDELTSYE